MTRTKVIALSSDRVAVIDKDNNVTVNNVITGEFKQYIEKEYPFLRVVAAKRRLKEQAEQE